MSNAYSPDLRIRVIDYVEAGGRRTEAAKLYKVSRDTIRRWMNQKKSEGTLKPKAISSRGGYKLKDTLLQAHVKTFPDQTLGEMGEALGVHETTVHYACKRLKITRKKNRSLPGKR
jgi:transposase